MTNAVDGKGVPVDKSTPNRSHRKSPIEGNVKSQRRHVDESGKKIQEAVNN